MKSERQRAMTGLVSMTGQGSADAPLEAATLRVEMRSVNHRFVEVRVRMPPELSEHTGFVEDLVRKRLGRGRVEVTVRVEGELAGEVTLDVARARSAFTALSALRDELAPGEPVPLSLLSSVPGLFSGARGVEDDVARASLAVALEGALEAMELMRAAEGKALAKDLQERVARVREQLSAIEVRVPACVENTRAKLRERIARLLEGTGVELDQGRLEHEVAHAADRADVTEECTRLRSHADQLDALVASDTSEPLGRKLDFLLQETGREANTIGSKSNDAELARLVVDLKAEIERMREQVQNVV